VSSSRNTYSISYFAYLSFNHSGGAIDRRRAGHVVAMLSIRMMKFKIEPIILNANLKIQPLKQSESNLIMHSLKNHSLWMNSFLILILRLRGKRCYIGLFSRWKLTLLKGKARPELFIIELAQLR